MQIGYIDDAGELGAMPATPRPNEQPVFALGMLIVEQVRLAAIVPEYLQLKRNYFPGLIPPASEFLDAVKAEIKGADLRRDVASGARNKSRHARRFLGEVLSLCERAKLRLACKVTIKAPGGVVNQQAVYTSSCQSLMQTFDHHLTISSTEGFVIADSRNHGLNVPVAHSSTPKQTPSRLRPKNHAQPVKSRDANPSWYTATIPLSQTSLYATSLHSICALAPSSFKFGSL
jgi:hypothetical protein